MTSIAVYVAIAIVTVIVTLLLVRRTSEGERSSIHDDRSYAQAPWDETSLRVALRLFDSADYLWLRDELGFPDLARSLARSRKHLSLRWFENLKFSFREMVRTPEPTASESSNNFFGDWRLLLLTLRFHFFLTYAVLVTQLFGPYHRLVPSLNWRHFIPEAVLHKTRLGTVNSNDMW
jgi:hypothetical protein